MLAPVVHWALKEIGLKTSFELIENPLILREMKITKTPAMMINGKILIEGRIPSGLEVIDILKKAKAD